MKVGDRVKTLIRKYGIPMFTEGHIYKIEDATINGGNIWYRFISDEDNDYQGLFLEHELKVIEENNAKECDPSCDILLDYGQDFKDGYVEGYNFGWTAYSKIKDTLNKLLSYGYTKGMIKTVLEQI